MIEIAFNLYIKLGRTDIFIIWVLQSMSIVYFFTTDLPFVSLNIYFIIFSVEGPQLFLEKWEREAKKRRILETEKTRLHQYGQKLKYNICSLY